MRKHEHTLGDAARTHIPSNERRFEHTHGDGSQPHDHTHIPSEEPQTHDHSHTHTNTKAVLNRLSRAIGHLTSVRGMVEQGRDCAEVLIQLAAVRSAINRTCEVILKDHLEHCVVDAIKTGDMEALEELKRAVELLLK
ncbi:MAG: metal-sensing transcriptional repressor [Peptococcaceae bacterium]|nr:metal-sensing transcriptional repressor [Peptococcaceae bacterium]